MFLFVALNKFLLYKTLLLCILPNFRPRRPGSGFLDPEVLAIFNEVVKDHLGELGDLGAIRLIIKTGEVTHQQLVPRLTQHFCNSMDCGQGDCRIQRAVKWRPSRHRFACCEVCKGDGGAVAAFTPLSVCSAVEVLASVVSNFACRFANLCGVVVDKSVSSHNRILSFIRGVLPLLYLYYTTIPGICQ